VDFSKTGAIIKRKIIKVGHAIVVVLEFWHTAAIFVR
jgi:hypothetical protein